MDWKNFCIKCLIWVSRIFLKTCGVALFFFFFGLAGFITLSFKNNVMDYYSEQGHYLIVIFSTIIYAILVINVFFNYLTAMFSSPGRTKDPEYREMLYRCAESDSEESFNCQYCNLPKPQNVHHCTTCNACVINLDHHCRKENILVILISIAWINNCVGFKNHRYFLLFLFYTWAICLFFFCLALPILFSDYEEIPMMLVTSLILSGTMMVILFCFNLWSWYIALSDQQFIDLLKRHRLNQNGGYFGEGQTQKTIVWTEEFIRARIFHIFGTRNIFHAFLPSLRKQTVNPFELTLETTSLIPDHN